MVIDSDDCNAHVNTVHVINSITFIKNNKNLFYRRSNLLNLSYIVSLSHGFKNLLQDKFWKSIELSFQKSAVAR